MSDSPDVRNIERARVAKTAKKRLEHDSQITETILESTNEGFAVWDSKQKLVAWSNKCPDFWYEPENILRPGMPMVELLRHIATKGGFGPGDPDKLARRELRRICKAGTDSEDEFQMRDGRVIHVQRNSMPDGGHASTYTDITERKQVEEALRESEERFRGLFNNSPMFISLQDTDGRFKLINQEHTVIFGFEPQDIVGKRISEVLQKKVAKDSVAHRRKVMETKAAVVEERPIITNRGTFDFLVTKFPILDESGAVKEIGTIGVDITKHKQAEDALRKSEERLRGAIESLQEGFVLFDVDDRLVMVNGVYREINPKAQEFLDKGMSFEDLIRANVEREWMVEALGREEDFICERLEQHRNPGPPIMRQFADGKWYILKETQTPEGGIALTFTDITDLKKIEYQLRESEERFRAVIESAPEAIVIRNLDGHNLIANKIYCDWFAADHEDVIGMTIQDSISKEDADDIMAREQNVAETLEVVGAERRKTYPDGVTRDIFSQKFPIFSPSGDCIAIGTIFNDITERKHAQDALLAAITEAETANRAKSKFMAAMSHEFRTPLHSILGFSGILSDQYFGPISEKYQEYSADILSSGKHLLELVNDLLDISAIEDGKRSLVKEKLSALEIVTECKKIIEEKARSLGIDLITEVHRDLPPLYADRRAFKQILINLLSNAVKFTPEGGKITVSVKASKKNLTLKVADTGKGIPADKLSKLTDPFTWASADPYLAEESWGLGLSITNSLVDLHDGTLYIKSKVGKGTTVTVILPKAVP